MYTLAAQMTFRIMITNTWQDLWAWWWSIIYPSIYHADPRWNVVFTWHRLSRESHTVLRGGRFSHKQVRQPLGGQSRVAPGCLQPGFHSNCSQQILNGNDDDPVSHMHISDQFSTLQVVGCLHPDYHRHWPTEHWYCTSDCLRGQHLLHRWLSRQAVRIIDYPAFISL